MLILNCLLVGLISAESHMESAWNASIAIYNTTSQNITISNNTTVNPLAHEHPIQNYNPVYQVLLIVLCAFIVGLMIMVLKSVSKRPRSQLRRYGLLSTCDDLDMTPLGRSYEDEEDEAVFDIGFQNKMYKNRNS